LFAHEKLEGNSKTTSHAVIDKIFGVIFVSQSSFITGGVCIDGEK
jgi:hypothetical protein